MANVRESKRVWVYHVGIIDFFLGEPSSLRPLGDWCCAADEMG